jgi:glycine/D-amino acid oxidase-like deaminating enzyme
MDREPWTLVLSAIKHAAGVVGWGGGRRRPVHYNWHRRDVRLVGRARSPAQLGLRARQLRPALSPGAAAVDQPVLATHSQRHSPDEHFITDMLPGYKNVAVAAGCSGHGFKFCSVVGAILSELAIDGRTQMPLELFALNRF